MVSDNANAASEIATEAGQVLLSVRETGGDPKAMKTFGDSAAQECISAQLAIRFPFDAVLSEEADDDSDRLTNRRVWIIDPLDGTREFSEPPRVDWAVHVALVEGGELVAGAVALPGEGLTFSSNDPLPRHGPIPPRPRILVSRTRPTEHAIMLAEQLGGELVAMGSAGAKAMAVVRGSAGRLCPLGRPMGMGFGGSCSRGPGGRIARVAPRWISHSLQPAESVAA